jgi:hypothetical protein
MSSPVYPYLSGPFVLGRIGHRCRIVWLKGYRHGLPNPSQVVEDFEPFAVRCRPGAYFYVRPVMCCRQMSGRARKLALVFDGIPDGL